MYAPGYLEEIKEKPYLLYSNGTFKCCPDPFEQFYAVVPRVENQTIPILIAFLPSKSNEAYTEVFIVVRAMVGDRKISLSIGLEQAVIKSIREVFPGQCEIHLCFFHLGQTIDRKMED